MKAITDDIKIDVIVFRKYSFIITPLGPVYHTFVIFNKNYNKIYEWWASFSQLENDGVAGLVEIKWK